MSADLTSSEEQVAKQFLEEVNSLRRQSNQPPISWKDAIKFCMARKFDKERAIELLQSYEETRLRERLLNINPCNDEVKKELLSGKLTILKDRDASGAAVALFTARFHNPLTSARNVTLQSLVHQLDAALDSAETQRNGLVFVYDMTDSKFSNFDYDLSVKILDLLKGSFPARLKKVLIVLAPLWFKATFKILRLFVREKLRDRVYTVDDSEILQHIPAISLPTHLGGTQTVNHIDWLRECLKSHRLPEPAVHAFFEGVKHPNYMTAKFAAHAQQVAALSRSNGSQAGQQRSQNSFPHPPPPVSNNHSPAAPNDRHTVTGYPSSQPHQQNRGSGDSRAPTYPPPPVPTRHSSQADSTAVTRVAVAGDNINHAGLNFNQSARSSNVSSSEDGAGASGKPPPRGARGTEQRGVSNKPGNQSAGRGRGRGRGRAAVPKNSDTDTSISTIETGNTTMPSNDSKANISGRKPGIGTKIKEKMSATKNVLSTSAQQLKLKLRNASLTSAGPEKQTEPDPHRVSDNKDQDEMIEPDSVSHSHQSNVIVPDRVSRPSTVSRKADLDRRVSKVTEDNPTEISFDPELLDDRRDTAWTRRTVPDDGNAGCGTEDNTVVDVIFKARRASTSSEAPAAELSLSLTLKRDTIMTMVTKQSSDEIQPTDPAEEVKINKEEKLVSPPNVSQVCPNNLTISEINRSNKSPPSTQQRSATKLKSPELQTKIKAITAITSKQPSRSSLKLSSSSGETIEEEEEWSVAKLPEELQATFKQSPESAAPLSEPVFSQLPIIPPIEPGKSVSSSETGESSGTATVTPTPPVTVQDEELANMIKQSDAMSAFYSSLLDPNAPQLAGLDFSALFPGFILPDMTSLIIPAVPLPPPQPQPQSALSAELEVLMKQSEDLQRQLEELRAAPALVVRPQPPLPPQAKGRRGRKKCGHMSMCGCSGFDVDESIAPKVPSLPPSWEDTDPTESVFPNGLTELMSPKDQLEQAVQMGKSGLISEYMRIKHEQHQDSFINSRQPANSTKNRYSDVLSYDFTRVILQHNTRDPSNDYINANHVNSFNQKRGYICCQGPLPKTFNDFWRMVWQERVRTIVMTTKLVEKGRTKCGTYWPQDINTMETFGDINVMNMDMMIDRSEDFQISTLCICNKNTGETRFIKHMLFLRWPDYGIPPSADAFLHFVKSVREIQARSVKEMPEWKGHPRGPPIIVHCSAGIGRTGTFICSDICMYLLDNTGQINIRQVVKLIRTQRAFAVQMPDQYVFCHLAILQYAQQQGILPPDIDIPSLLEDDDL